MCGTMKLNVHIQGDILEFAMDWFKREIRTGFDTALGNCGSKEELKEAPPGIFGTVCSTFHICRMDGCINLII
jgi:hypothetical protein